MQLALTIALIVYLFIGGLVAIDTYNQAPEEAREEWRENGKLWLILSMIWASIIWIALVAEAIMNNRK